MGFTNVLADVCTESSSCFEDFLSCSISSCLNAFTTCLCLMRGRRAAPGHCRMHGGRWRRVSLRHEQEQCDVFIVCGAAHSSQSHMSSTGRRTPMPYSTTTSATAPPSLYVHIAVSIRAHSLEVTVGGDCYCRIWDIERPDIVTVFQPIFFARGSQHRTSGATRQQSRLRDSDQQTPVCAF